MFHYYRFTVLKIARHCKMLAFTKRISRYLNSSSIKPKEVASFSILGDNISFKVSEALVALQQSFKSFFRFSRGTPKDFRQFSNACSEQQGVDEPLSGGTRFTNRTEYSLIERMRVRFCFFTTFDESICELHIIYVMSKYSELNAFRVNANEKLTFRDSETRTHLPTK